MRLDPNRPVYLYAAPGDPKTVQFDAGSVYRGTDATVTTASGTAVASGAKLTAPCWLVSAGIVEVRVRSGGNDGAAGSPLALDPAGFLVPTTPFLPVTFNLTAQRLYVTRFVAPRDCTTAQLAFALTAVSSGNDAVHVGILSGDLQTEIADSGAVTGKLNGSVGVKTVDLVADLEGGVTYYAALLVPTITSTITILAAGGPAAGNGRMGDLLGTAAPTRVGTFRNSQTTIGPLTANDGGIDSVPLLAVRL